MNISTAEINALPVAERVRLMETLWESLSNDADDPGLTPDWHRQVLDQRATKEAGVSLWPNSKMSCLHYSQEGALEDYPCIVRIDGSEILVEYEDGGSTRQYRGRNNGDGHFELLSPEIQGKASLHRFPESLLLEGSWVEGSYRGMWRIKLG